MLEVQNMKSLPYLLFQGILAALIIVEGNCMAQELPDEELPALPTLSDVVPNAEEDTQPEEVPTEAGSEHKVELDFLADLQKRVDDLRNKSKAERLSKIDRQLYSNLKQELKLATMISKQMEKLQFSNRKLKSKDRSDSDSFVFAKIALPQDSREAQITFEPVDGLINGVEVLTKFIHETPAGSFRDYRLVSRHVSNSDAQIDLEHVRQAYDEQKEREKQMIEYIIARNKMLARIQAARRC